MLLAISTAVAQHQWAISSLLTTIAWPPLLHLLLLATVNNWVPIAHMFSPPVYHSRESRLVAAEQGISYPTAEVEGDVSSKNSLLALCCSLAVCLILCGALMVVVLS